MAFTFNLQSLHKTMAALQLAKKKTLDDTADFIIEQAKQAFNNKKLGRTKWKPLKGKSQATGSLKNSLKKKTDMRTGVITIYSDLNYFKYQNLGTKDVPARPFVKMNKDIKDFAKLAAIKNFRIYVSRNL